MNDSRIYLRPITEADTPDIVRWRNSEIVRQYFITQADFTPESHMYWFNNYIKTGKAVQFMIVTREDNKPIGSVYIKDLDNEHKKGEYGIFIGEGSYLGKGYGSEAARLMLEYAFRTMKLHRVYLRAFTDNERAVGSYKKVGFEVEGILRDDVCIRGRFRDITWMAAINPAD